MFDEIMEEMKQSMAGVMEALDRDLQKTRTGRANLNMLDAVRISYYGTMTPLNQVAALAVADPRLITIKPWEKNLLIDIERAIVNSDLGITPSNDGELIRLPIPPLSQERRIDICKQVRSRGEDGKISIRNVRRDANELLKAIDGSSEDDVKRELKRVQDTTDQKVRDIDELIKTKEAEIMAI
jgi:ribosome recycling factor